MAVSILPYGKLANGKLGLSIDDVTKKPLAAVIEVLTALPAAADPDNFEGRVVFDTTQQIMFIYRAGGSNNWFPLDGAAVTVAAVDPPPSSPVPATGELYYSTTTKTLYMYNGAAWVKVGGDYASSILIRNYTGDGTTDMFATGASTVLPVQFIECYIDGVAQAPLLDYISLGSNVQFLSAPPTGTRVMVRTLVATNLVQTAQVLSVSYTGNGVTTDYDTGTSALSASSVLVAVNGVVKVPVLEYNLISQNTTISSLTRSGTVATAITTVAHGLGVGAAIEIAGVFQSGWNGSFTILTVPAANSFTFTVSSTLPTPATASPVIYYQPASTNDKVHFFSPPANGAVVSLRIFKSIVTAPATGEANVGTNLGSGVPVYAGKSGVNLQFKTLTDGDNTQIIDNGDGTIRIDMSDGELVDERVAFNTASFQVPGNVNYVACLDTTSPVTISLVNIPTGPLEAGRSLCIGDESGLASVNNITITTGSSAKINGSVAPIAITTDYGYVVLKYDGTDWYVRGAG